MVAVRAPSAQFWTSSWRTKALSALPSKTNPSDSASCRRGSGRLDRAKSFRYLDEKRNTPAVVVEFERVVLVALNNWLNLLACYQHIVGLLNAIVVCVSEMKASRANGNGWKTHETTEGQWPLNICSIMWCRCIGTVAHVATAEDSTLLLPSECLHLSEIAQIRAAFAGHIEPWHKWNTQSKVLGHSNLI